MINEEEKQIKETLELGLTVGCVVRDARRKTRKHIKTISQDLNISIKYLEGIENDDYSSFPGDAYKTGFVKQYAKYLELDENKVVEQLIKEQFSEDKTHVFNKMGRVEELERKKHSSYSRFINQENEEFNNWGLIILAVIVFLIILFFALFNRGGKKDVEPIKSPVLIEEMLNEDVVLIEDIAPMIFSEEIESFDEPENNVEVIEEEIIEIAPTVYGSKYLSDSYLTIDVIEDSTIEIYDRDKEEDLFSGDYIKTDKIIVPNRDDIIMKTNNAGGVLLVFNEEKMAPLGEVGEELDYISLDSDNLEDGVYKPETKEKKSGFWF